MSAPDDRAVGTRLVVDTALCAGHGRCLDTASAVLGYDDDSAQAYVLPDVDPTLHRAEIDEAISGCPEAALRWAGDQQ